MIWPILEARAEIEKYFVHFLVKMKTSKFAFEINWPLRPNQQIKLHPTSWQYPLINYLEDNFVLDIRLALVSVFLLSPFLKKYWLLKIALYYTIVICVLYVLACPMYCVFCMFLCIVVEGRQTGADSFKNCPINMNDLFILKLFSTISKSDIKIFWNEKKCNWIWTLLKVA